jgi:hypothetical protein
MEMEMEMEMTVKTVKMATTVKTEMGVTAILMGRIGLPLITMTLKTLRVQGLHYLNENL